MTPGEAVQMACRALGLWRNADGALSVKCPVVMLVSDRHGIGAVFPDQLELEPAVLDKICEYGSDGTLAAGSVFCIFRRDEELTAVEVRTVGSNPFEELEEQRP